MKTAVLIPSHIYYPDQLARLNKCLESLASQTVVPDIFLSISFENDTYKRECSTLIYKYPTVKFRFSAQQKFQMEHLSTLSLLVSDYDMVMFCDDDDTYLPMRVEEFVNTFEYGKEYCNQSGVQFGGVKEIEHINNPYAEYWAYGIKPTLLNQFFNRIKGYEDLMRHQFADMYLRNYLIRTGSNSIHFAAIQADISGLIMYRYTTNNPNSICARNMAKKQTPDNANTIIRDNVTLSLICDEIKLVEKSMREASAPMNMLNEVVPDAIRIKTLTKILYK